MMRWVRTLAAIGAALTLSACGGAAGNTPAEGDMAKGAGEDARVTVVEYASVTCGVCAAWQKDVWPEFKAKYVDTNQVRFVFREYPTPPQPVAVAGFLLARCAGADRYFEVVEEIMASQQEMFGPAGARPTLLRIANGVGLSEEQFQQCVTDEAAIAAMDERIKAANDAGVGGTPTFLVNGEQVSDPSLAGLSTAVDAALAEAG